MYCCPKAALVLDRLLEDLEGDVAGGLLRGVWGCAVVLFLVARAQGPINLVISSRERVKGIRTQVYISPFLLSS